MARISASPSVIHRTAIIPCLVDSPEPRGGIKASFSREGWRRLEQLAAANGLTLHDQLLAAFMEAFKRPADERSSGREGGIIWLPVVVRIEPC